MLTLRLSNLISLAARNNRRNPTLPANPVASIMLPTTVMKSNVFQESLKYACKWEDMCLTCVYTLFNLFVHIFLHYIAAENF